MQLDRISESRRGGIYYGPVGAVCNQGSHPLLGRDTDHWKEAFKRYKIRK